MSQLFLYCLDVHFLKILAILPLMEGFEYFKKLGIEKADLEEFRGEGVELIYATYLPTNMTSDIQTQKGKYSPHNEVYLLNEK